MDGFSLRVASLKDKSSVLAIRNNVYGGFDFLPAYYDFFVKSPNVTPYVAVLDGEIVGFVAGCLVDGGETVVDRAGRVSPTVQGKGLYKHMLDEIRKLVLASKKVKRKAFGALQNNSKIYTSSFLQHHSLVLTRAIRTYSKEPRLSKCPDSFHSHQASIKHMDGNDFRKFMGMLSRPTADYLFPAGRVVVDWVPFRLQSTNVALMKGPDTVYATDVHLDSGKEMGLLSISNQHALQHLGRLCNIDIYGTDTRSLIHHLTFHLQRAAQIPAVKTYLFIFTDHKIADAELDAVMNVLDIHRDSLSNLSDGAGSSIRYTEQRVYETKHWKAKHND